MRCSLLTLSCYLDSELDARQQGEMEAHLVGCPRCRAGLSHLREEVERVGGLARVRVPDRSARAMLELLGLIVPGGELPPRSSQLPDAPPSDLPWLGAQAGQALPWVAPPKMPRRAGASARGGPGSGGSSALAEEPHVLTAPPAAPGRTAAEEAAREEADVAMMAPGEASAVPPVVSASGEAPGSTVAATAPPETHPPSRTHEVQEAPAPQTAASTTTDSPPPSEPPTSTPESKPPERVPPRPYFVGSAMARPTKAADRPAERLRPSQQPDALALQMLLSEQIAIATMPARSAASPTPPAPPLPSSPPGETPVAVSLPETPDVPSPATHGAAAVDAGTPGGDPTLIEALEPEGPLPAPRATLFERFREKLAMRRALSGHAAGELDDGVEVVSGMGAPLRRGSSRADLARRRNEALRPASPSAPQPVPTRELRAGQMLAPAAHPSERPVPTSLHGVPVDLFSRSPLPASTSPGQRESAGQLARLRSVPPPPSAATAPRTTSAAAAAASASFGQARVLQEETRIGATPLAAAAPAPGIPPAAVGPDAPTKLGPSPSELREGRRLLFLYIGAVVVLFVIGLVSARTTTPLTTSSTSSSSTSMGSTSASSTATSQQPAPTQAAPTTPATPAAAQHPTAAPPPAPQSVGAGGTGWQVRGFRFGDHGTYYLVVMDLTGAGAFPNASVSSQDPQTLLLTLAGTAAAASPALPPPGGWVSHVALVTPSPTPGAVVYRISLSKPGTAKLATLTSPSRIVVEIR